MLAPHRQAIIAQRVRERGAVRVAELVEHFGVSDMTIRRDLETLANRGLIAKVHGGATAIDAGATNEPGFDAKAAQQRGDKEAIADLASSLVSQGQTIALSGGTTTWMLAQRLVRVPALTVVTNSIPVADVFYTSGRDDQRVILTGGTRTPSDVLVGPLTVASLATLNVDALFLGVHGVSATAGFTTPNLEESETNRALIKSARQLVVLVDHTKWETVGLCTIASTAEAHILVTDQGMPMSARSTLEEQVGQLLIAGEGDAGEGHHDDDQQPTDHHQTR